MTLTDWPVWFLFVFTPLYRKSCLTHMPSSTSCSSSLWRPCSSSASCLFSATICGWCRRTGQLLVRINQGCSTLSIQLWTVFPDYFTFNLSETFSAPVFTSGRDKSGFSLGCGRNVTEVFGDRAKYWMFPVFSRWAGSVLNADLSKINHDNTEDTGYFWVHAPGCSQIIKSGRRGFAKAACTVLEYIMF